MKELRLIAKGGLYLLTGDISRRIISYFFLFFASNLLGPAILGAYYWAAAILALLIQLSLFGTVHGMNYFVPRYEAEHGQNSSLSVLNYVLRSALFRAVLVAIVLFTFAPQLACLLQQPKFGTLLRVFAISLPTAVGWVVFNRYFVARYDVKTSVLFGDIVKGLIRLAAMLLLVFFGIKHYAMIGSDIIMGSILIVLGFLLVSRKYGAQTSPDLTRSDRSRVMLYSFPFLVFTLLKSEQVLIMLIGFFGGVRDIAVFHVSLKIVLLVNFFLIAINTMFRPVTSGLIAEKRWEVLRSNYKAITRWILIGSLPIFCLIMMYPASFLNVFGPRFVNGAPALRVLAIGYFFSFVTSATSTIINMSGRTWLNLFNLFVQLLIACLSGVLLIPRFGIVGAALAFSAGLIYVNLVRLYQATKIVNALPYSMYLWKPIVANAAAGAAVAFIFPLGRLYEFWQLIPLLSVYASIYLALILIVRINQEDWLLLAAAMQKFKRKVNWQQENG